MSANLQYGRGNAQSLVTAVREQRVDVLVLLEITPDAVDRLSAAGLSSLLPDSVGRSRQDAGGTIIRSRLPLTLVAESNGLASSGAFDQPVVSVHRKEGDVMLRAVHSLPPGLSRAADWRSGLDDLQSWRERQPNDRPLVMTGDFNSSQSHPAFRHIATSMTDAGWAAGSGWVQTWPLESRVPPFVVLDHVLVRDLAVVDAGTATIPGTDHRAVWARLRQQPASSGRGG
jgi:endonuclease/exonuclease/phosphatase family metal-dependent hydrolase